MTAAVAVAAGLSYEAAIMDGGGGRQQQHPWKQRWSRYQEADGTMVPA